MIMCLRSDFREKYKAQLSIYVCLSLPEKGPHADGTLIKAKIGFGQTIGCAQPNLTSTSTSCNYCGKVYVV